MIIELTGSAKASILCSPWTPELGPFELPTKGNSTQEELWPPANSGVVLDTLSVASPPQRWATSASGSGSEASIPTARGSAESIHSSETVGKLFSPSPSTRGFPAVSKVRAAGSTLDHSTLTLLNSGGPTSKPPYLLFFSPGTRASPSIGGASFVKGTSPDHDLWLPTGLRINFATLVQHMGKSSISGRSNLGGPKLHRGRLLRVQHSTFRGTTSFPPESGQKSSLGRIGLLSLVLGLLDAGKKEPRGSTTEFD